MTRPPEWFQLARALWALWGPARTSGQHPQPFLGTSVVAPGSSGPSVITLCAKGVFQRHHGERCAWLPHECRHVPWV